MKKYLLWGAVSMAKLINEEYKVQYRNSPVNTGNLVIGHTVQTHLGYFHDELAFRDILDPHVINEKYHAVVIPASSFIRENLNLDRQVEFLEKIKLPIVCIGLGAQAKTVAHDVEIKGNLLRFLQLISAKSISIGVRGFFTAELLYKSGIRNVDVIGCPSCFLNMDPDFTIDKKPFSDNIKGVFCLTSHPLASNLLDIAIEAKCAMIGQTEKEELELVKSNKAEFINSKIYHEFYTKSKFSVDEVFGYLSGKMQIFYNTKAWQNSLSKNDFSFGMRFHGNMLALQQKIPALWITHDSRTTELVEFLKLPSLMLQDQLKFKNIKEMYEYTDYSCFNQFYYQLFQNYSDFLDKNGLEHLLPKKTGVNPSKTDGCNNSLNAEKRRVLVVLGMHRSGTSVITRGLKVLGIELGDRLFPANVNDNPKGYWEHSDILALNIEMLDTINHDTHFLSPIKPEEFEILRQHSFHQRALALLQQNTGRNVIFGFKDPRLGKLLPFWKEVFTLSRYDASYIIAVRNPLSVSKSLAKRTGFDLGKVYLLWLDHILCSLWGTENCDRIVVDYDKVMNGPEKELKRIATAFHLEIDFPELEFYLNEFLDRQLRHTYCNLFDLQQDKAAFHLIPEVYATLMELSSETVIDDRLLLMKVKLWREEFERLSPALIIADKTARQKQEIEQTLTTHLGEIISLNNQLTLKDRLLAQLSQELSQTRKELSGVKNGLAYKLACNVTFQTFFYGINKQILSLKKKYFSVDDLTLIRRSNFFDKTYYLRQNPELTQGDIDPAEHFLRKGGFEGRNPGLNFDCSFYLNNNPDVEKSSINPLVHYLRYGKKEKRVIQPVIKKQTPE